MHNYPFLSRIAIYLLLPFLSAVGLAAVYFYSSLPTENGEVRLTTLANRVNIEFDALGVPNIQAKTDHDVFFAMGYLHARDRMWQMEVQRRIARGTLSELVGAGALEVDIYMRTLGLVASASDAWEALSVDAKDSLQAYADGVNAWQATDPQLSPEFSIVGVRPENWTVVDSLAWMKVFSLNLSGNHQKELERFSIGAAGADPKLRSILGLGADSASMPTVLNQGDIARLAVGQSSIHSWLGFGGGYVGSNAWVVSERFLGKRGAMLANDPHLGLGSPSPWYPVSQTGDKLRVSGMSLVGLPLVVFGRNSEIAWGGTAMQADVQDLYLEQVNPGDPSLYLVNGKWAAFELRNEAIAIKTEFPEFLHEKPKPVVVTTRSTRHGPIISDRSGAGSSPLALRWTGLNKNDTTFDAFLRLSYAKNWNDFRNAVRLGVAPTLNMLYADREGNIGMQGFGHIPIRQKGHGNVPSAGWDNSQEWTGTIAFSNMPTVFNPQSGFIVSANDRNVPADYPYFVSEDWAPAGRANRIKQLLEQLLAKDGKLGTASFQQMQLDVHSIPAQELSKSLTKMTTTSERQREALQYIADWDGRMGSDSQAATIFSAWMTHFRNELYAKYLHAKVPAASESRYLDGIVSGVSLEMIQEAVSGKDPRWCGPASATDAPRCSSELATALDMAIAELTKFSGTDMRKWTWGGVHYANYQHKPFSSDKLLKHLFDQNSKGGGSADTINVADSVFDKTDGYKQTFGPTFRQIIKMSPSGDTHQFVNSTGQSGNIVSRHYSDANRLFSQGMYADFSTTKLTMPLSAIALIPSSQSTKSQP